MGEDNEPEYLEKYPAHLTPMIEEEGLPQGDARGELRDHGVPLQQARPRPAYPTDPGKRAMVDNAMFYLIGTFCPLLTRATYPALGFPQYPGEVATSAADDLMKANPQRDAEAALAEPLDVFRSFFLDGLPFIGGDTPSIADIRLSATLEFLDAIDYDLPAWARERMAAMETALAMPMRSRPPTSRLHRLREALGSAGGALGELVLERAAAWIRALRRLAASSASRSSSISRSTSSTARSQRSSARLPASVSSVRMILRCRGRRGADVAAVDQLAERLAHRLRRDERTAGDSRWRGRPAPQDGQRDVGRQLRPAGSTAAARRRRSTRSRRPIR